MPSLGDHFGSLTRVRPPETWPDLGDLEPVMPGARPRFRRLGVAALALALGAVGVAVAVRAFRAEEGSPRPAASVENGLIAFGCGYHICTMAPDGTGITDLIEPYDRSILLAAYGPVWSPDGTRIAFYGYPQGATDGGANYDLYVMNADGFGVRNLTTSPEDIASGFSQLDQKWSPDGTMIAYDGDDGLYVMNADGSAQRKIADGGEASWSPDGSRIVFAGGAGLYTVRPDGTGLTQLTSGPGFDDLPTWSPDGSRISFLSGHAIYVMNADGSGQIAVFDVPGAEPYTPVWAPDGTWLAFEAYVQKNYDIYSVTADGTGLKDLTPTPDRDENDPVWSPDGTTIAFQATHVLARDIDNTGSFDIYLMSPDGSGEERLTRNFGTGGHDLSWQSASVAEASASPAAVAAPSPHVVAAIPVGQRLRWT